MANSMTVDDVALSTYGCYVERGQLPGMPTPAESVRSVAQQDGGVASPRVYQPAEIETEVAITAASHSTLLSNLDSLKATLSSREDVEVKWDRWTDRYWLGRCSLDSITLVGPTLARATITTVCADPVAFAVTQSTAQETGINVGIGGGDWTVTAARTSRAYPTITLTYTGAQSGGTTLKHDALDTRLVYTGALVSGDKLRIKCDPAEWLVEKMATGTDAYVAAMDKVSGRFPHMEPGANVFYAYYFTGTIDWAWRNRYL